MPNAKGDFCRLFDLLNQHDKIALAVSGGPDSTALMVLAAQWAQRHDKLHSLSVLTVNHQLRDNAGQEAEQVRRWASALGLGCHVLTWQHEEQSAAIQEKARAGRYELMGRWCRENGVAGIVTAHNSDDQAETMLMRLARGSGVDGLAAMRSQAEIFGAVVFRPLLDESRAILRTVLQQAGQDWIEDPSNHNRQFERVRVRQAMAAVEEAGIGREALNLSAQRLTRASAALEQIADQFMAEAVEVFNTGYCMINRAGFEALVDDIAIRVLSRLVDWAGGRDVPVRMVKVERLLEAIRQDSDNRFTLGGAQINRRKNTILIGREYGRIDNGIQTGVTAWDRRFVFDHPQDVHPYGRIIDGDSRTRPEDLPYFVACSLPAIIDQGGKVHVPHLDFPIGAQLQLLQLPRGIAAPAPVDR